MRPPIRDQKSSASVNRRVNILGVGISPINLDNAVETIMRWINQNQPHYVCVTPAHSIMDCYFQPELRAIFNASGMTTPDGMSIVWILKLLGYHHVTRVYGPDLLLEVCKESSDTDIRHFFYGGHPGVPEKLANQLGAIFPGLSIAGMYSPPFRELTSEEDQAIINIINQAKPDIVWVGISSPKQELWMAQHLNRLNVPVLVGVGAAFDFHSGRKKQAPHWMQRYGLEWFFRLISEPRRLWRRYVVNYPLFGILILAQAMGLTSYLDEGDNHV